MSNQLEVKESPAYLSSAHEITYSTDTVSYGGSPSGITVTATNLSTGKDVSAYVLTGSASVSGDVITWPTIQDLVKGQQYAVDIAFVCNGQTYKDRLVIYTIM